MSGVLESVFERALDPFRPKDEANVKPEISPSSVTYTLTGTRGQIDYTAATLFRKYAPDGYGTHLKSLRKLPNGTWEAVIERSASCD